MGIADTRGLAALTMRSLADELGAKPMSLYHYIRSKDELLHGLVDLVFAEIELPQVGGPWHSEVRRRALSARAVQAQHPWALTLVEAAATPPTPSRASGSYPHLIEFATQHVQQPGYSFSGQFEFGLDLILDALAKHAS